MMRGGLAVAAATLVGGAALIAGCSTAAPAPPAPKHRALIESQVRAFTDRVFADYRNSSDLGMRAAAASPDRVLFSGAKSYRSAVEADGRAVCSHIIAGVPVDQAFQAAYPQSPVTEAGLRTTRIAADTLCPEQ
jgi:hypothetical protein